MQEDARESAMKLEAELRTKAFEYEKKFRETEDTLHVEVEKVKKPLDAKTEATAEAPVQEEDPRQLRIDFGEK
ncbi:MAG TPA: hypothetical protein PLK99_00380, partial [Burkholderiales bacterium]|nr:hypothetical protein [Burkholderiales bacterium]